MKQYFDTQIKPLNDELGKSLGYKKVQVIEVAHEDKEKRVPVTVWIQTWGGTYIRVESSKLANYRAMGLYV